MFIRLIFGKRTLKKLIIVIVGIILLIVVVSVMRPKGNSGLQGDDNPMLKLTAEEIRSLQYVVRMQIEESSTIGVGITKYHQNLSYNGINLFVSTSTNQAYFMDMDGNILHTWSQKNEPRSDNRDNLVPKNNWMHPIMYPNGDLLVVKDYGTIIKLDWDSNIEWVNDELSFHHDIAIADNGDIYSLASYTRMNVSYSSQPINIIDGCLVILSNTGKIKKNICLFELFDDSIGPNILSNVDKTIKQFEQARKYNINISELDIFHLNGLYIINRDILGFGKKGDVILSLSEQNIILVLDVEKEEIVWTWGTEDLDFQHSPILLDNGNILIFDNGQRSRNYSRIIELDPIKKEIVWEYIASPPNSFYSPNGGGCQQLSNGNILITETTRGRAFEITRKGEIVWEFYNPVIYIQQRRESSLFRLFETLHMQRINPKQLDQKVLERIDWTME